MYEKILVPLDGSKLGEAALPYIEDLVSKLTPEPKVEVILFQVVSSLTHFIVAGEAGVQVPYTEQEMEQIRQRALSYLEKAGEGLRKKGAVVGVRVSTGEPADEINNVANELDVDLVAMSTHGRSGLSRWAFGSVADKVLRGGSKPVLIVRVSGEGGKAD
jgi:nucleotide-binding universal stress UspA family protein